MTLIILADRPAVALAAADQVVAIGRAAAADHGVFTLALSGGSTPRDLYALLAAAPWRDQIDWSRTHLFWGDERCVPPDDPRSNYLLARQALIDLVPIPAQNVHPPDAMRALADAEAAAAYADEVRSIVPDPAAGGLPCFDLVLLGLGDDGHTASLLPGSRLVYEQVQLVAVTDLQREGTTRLTFTPPLLQAAAHLLFLVAGSDKAAALREVLEGAPNLARYPAQVSRQARGKVFWLVDRAAAAKLSEGGH